eukprot:TRINITY_DN1230_c0_g1_i1.p1 TRINITY_DN1230_c0_g1~~TRINITY_DN1230_c0_g1_i1.p1  ORF type:complete len:467 (+),score=125.75 TRINITY_DN1230_c0_g1_i1:85-1401(+)
MSDTEREVKEDRHSLCDVCHAVQWRYRCPRCSMRTCSLDCSRKHKSDTDCSGIRDRAPFKEVSELTVDDLLSDYRLLEDTRLAVSRVTSEQKSNVESRNLIPPLPRHLAALQKAARDRGTFLKFVARGMTRRKKNTTFYNHKKRHIFWHVEFIFASSESVNCVPLSDCEMHPHVVVRRMIETSSICEMLHKILAIEHESGQKEDVPDFPSSHCPVELRRHRMAFLSGSYCVFLERSFKTNPGSVSGWKVDIEKSLQHTLQKRVILEHPTFLFVRSTDRIYTRSLNSARDGSEKKDETEKEDSSQNEFGVHALDDANCVEIEKEFCALDSTIRDGVMRTDQCWDVRAGDQEKEEEDHHRHICIENVMEKKDEESFKSGGPNMDDGTKEEEGLVEEIAAKKIDDGVKEMDRDADDGRKKEGCVDGIGDEEESLDPLLRWV